MTRSIPFVRLIRHIDLADFGCEDMASGDIDGDGLPELVFMQGPAMLAAAMFRPGGLPGFWYGPNYTTADDQALDCVTAVGLDGKIRWQRGKPWAKDFPFRTHGGFEMIRAIDIDGDGRAELLRIRGDQLQSLDGRTGQTRAAATLDNDGYSQITPARFRGDLTRQLVLKPCSDGVDGHPHGCPVVAFDHNLKPLWDRRDFTRVGHVPLAFDVDGDGRDELLIGFDCVNPDGSVRWTLPLAGGKGHPDRRTVIDLDGDGKSEMILACEDLGMVVADLRGNILWRRDSEHCGEAVVGKFFADRPGLQILYNNEHWRVNGDETFGTTMVDARGEMIWKSPRDLYAVPVDWPNPLGPQAMLTRPHAADPEDGRPFIMDGNGETLALFDIPLHAPRAPRDRLPQAHLNVGDWGDYYSYRAVNVPGEGTRILIWTRRDLWIFATTT